MRRPRGGLFLTALGLIGTWVIGHAQQTQQAAARGRAVLTDTEALLLGDAELVAGPRVLDVKPSPDGRYLLARRLRLVPSIAPAASGQPPAGESSLVLWDSRSRHASVVWRRPLNQGGVGQVSWLPGTDLALAEAYALIAEGAVPQRRRSLLFLDGSRATARTLTPLGQNDELLVSPAQPLAVLHRVNENGGSLHLVRTNGTLGAAIPLPENVAVSGGWSEDGTLLHLVDLDLAAIRRKERPVRKWHAVDPRTGAVRPLAERPKPPAERPSAAEEKTAALPVRLKSSTVTLKEEDTTQTLRPIWLAAAAKSERPRALLTPDGENEFLLPDGSAALYRSGGSLYAVPLVRVNKEAWRKALQEATLSNAKQIGLGLMMYAQDYDEAFPPASDDVNDVILPYIKNRAVFNSPVTDAPGFVYLQNGGTLSGIAKPAETVIGYVIGPGGRAMIYADGHVTWQPD